MRCSVAILQCYGIKGCEYSDPESLDDAALPALNGDAYKKDVLTQASPTLRYEMLNCARKFPNENSDCSLKTSWMNQGASVVGNNV